MAGLVVGIDIATADIRAVAADGSGRVTASAAAPLAVAEDARTWWPVTAGVLRELTSQLQERVVAVSVAATSGTVVALDGSGEPVAPALLYHDQSAAAEAETAQAAGADRWARLGLRIQPSFGLPKLARLMGPGVGRLAHVPDVIVGRLLGRPPDGVPTDWSHALKSGWDVLAGEWAAEALDALGVPLRLLPEVRPPATAVGGVSEEAAAATGLPSGCQVVLGMTDACAAQLAAGAGDPGRFVSVLGTTLVLKGASENLVADPAGAVYCHRHPGGWWLPGGASSTGGKALTGDDDVAALDRAAAERGPARAVVYPLVGRGERFPFAVPDAEGFTLGEPEDQVERHRARLEGVAFVERLGFERLAALGAGPVTPPIAVAGGGSRSRVWNRIRATVLGMPVVEKPHATTALGAAILAAAGTLHPDLVAATGAMAVDGERVEPVHEDRERLDGNYRRFVEALAARGWWSG